MKCISILGVTGSIGTQTLEVLRFHKEEFKLCGITAHKNIELTLEIIKEFQPEYVAISDKESYKKLKEILEEQNIKCNLLYGMNGLIKVATLDEVTTVLTSVVGMIGLKPTLEAIKKGKNIALANKETLVVAGEIVMREAKNNNVSILPVDSEHSAIYQCLKGNDNNKIGKIILTASGGPFRGYTLEELKNVTVQKALKHPKWSMGKKISIDSSTLMNKGLEVIEAHWLFNCDYDDIKVVIHPQSIIHSMVEYTDGAVIAQLGTPDMKLPIQYALNNCNRKEAIGEKLDFCKIKQLTFEEPDMKVFQCLELAYKAGKIGGLMPTVVNAANEVCVELFLNNKINYLEIPEIIKKCMENFNCNEKLSLEGIITMDKKVRDYVYKNITRR